MIAADSSFRIRAFSLVEVAIALGVAATGLLVVLTLLPGLLRQHAEAQEALVVAGLPNAVTVELRRMAGANLAEVGGRSGSFTDETSALRLVAAIDGSDVRELTAQDDRAKYFLIELHRFPAGTPLGYDPSAPFLALQARVSWPFRPDGTAERETPSAARQRVVFNVCLNQ